MRTINTKITQQYKNNVDKKKKSTGNENSDIVKMEYDK